MNLPLHELDDNNILAFRCFVLLHPIVSQRYPIALSFTFLYIGIAYLRSFDTFEQIRVSHSVIREVLDGEPPIDDDFWTGKRFMLHRPDQNQERF